MPALVPHDHEAMKDGARRWLKVHTDMPADDIDRLRRLTEEDAKHAFSMLTMVAMRSRLGSMGGAIPEPCVRCGYWTHGYCESCQLDLGPPRAICSTCDGARLVCPQCLSAGRHWEVGRKEHDARFPPHENVMEVNGFHDENGTYTECNPPLLIDVHDLQPEVDSLFYAQELMARIQNAVNARRQT